MIGATNDQMKVNLVAHRELRCEERNLWFADAQAQSIRVDLRVKEPHQLICLARLVAHLGDEEADFDHGYLWVTTWGVWNHHDEAIALKTLEQFRRSYGESRSIEAAPGTYFRHDEFKESVACLVQPMLVGWDAYYVPAWAWGSLDYFVTISHDSFLDIETRTPEMYEKARRILADHEWMRQSVG